ncbi:MAG: trimethylamine methyltransferase family protein [Thermodesulfobacteriota bacterium]
MGFRRDGLKGGFLKFLTEAEIEHIHKSSLELLEEVGMEIDDQDMLKLLKKSGCKVDFSTNISRVPRELIEDILKEIPHQMRLCGRRSMFDITPGDGTVYARTTGGPPYIADLNTGERREGTLEDLALCCRVADALENIHGISVFQVVPMDVPRMLLDVYAAQTSFLNTEKHLFYYTQNPDLVEYVLEMAALVAGGEEELKKRPLLSGFCEATSPLKLDRRQTTLLTKFVRKGLPVYTHSHPIAGVTSPVTLAGEVALSNAETLMVVTIAQLLAPHTPILYGTSASVPDMRTALNLAGTVEVGLLGCALAHMARFYHLPSTMTSGMDAKILDAQAMMERILTSLPPILTGIDLINLSTTDTKMTFTLPLLVIDNELMSWINRLLRGFTVNEETLAIDLIRRVARKELFLSEDHTVKHFREELLGSKLVNRGAWDDWKMAGSPSLWQKALDDTKKIAREHQPAPLSGEVQRNLAAIVKSAKDHVS